MSNKLPAAVKTLLERDPLILSHGEIHAGFARPLSFFNVCNTINNDGRLIIKRPHVLSTGYHACAVYCAVYMQCLLTAKAFFSRLFPFNRIAYVLNVRTYLTQDVYVERRKGRDVGDEELWIRQLDEHAPKKDNRR